MKTKILIAVRDSALWIRKTAGVSVSVAGVLIALSVLKGTSVDPRFHENAYSIMMWLGIAIFSLLVLAWPIYEISNWASEESIDNFRSAKRHELQEVIPFYDRVVGGDRPTINALKELFNANNKSFVFYEKISYSGGQKRTKVLGFCTIIPVTTQAEKLLEREELNGLRLDRAHVVRPGAACASIYIGSIGADGQSAKAAVLNYVLGQLHSYASAGVKRAYTRPVTKDGLRVAKKYAFVPVGGDVRGDELHRLYYLDLDADVGVQVRRKYSSRRHKSVDQEITEQ